MATTGVTITRNDRRVLQAIIRANPGKVEDAVRAAASEINNEIVLSFGTSPSSPGDPPGVDTGALRGSMHAEPDASDRFKAYVAAGVEYAGYLEYGTERMAARPFFAPVFLRWRRGELSRFLRDFGLFTP